MSDDGDRVVSLGKVKAARGRRCPICRQSASVADAPFCSKRCADIDLGRWLRGVYSIPGPDSTQPDEGDEEDY